MPAPPKSLARVTGSPGAGVRAAGALRVMAPAVALLAVTGVCVGLSLPVPRIPPPTNAFLLVICAAGLVATLRWGRARLDNYLVGAAGEEQVGRALGMLPAAYHVYHGVPISRSRDLDHVVCGPTGIWVVETTWREGLVAVRDGGVLLDGEPMDYPPDRKASAGADALVDELRRRAGLAPEVRAVVCFAGARLAPDPAVAGKVVLTTPDSLGALVAKPGNAPNEAVLQRCAAALDNLLSGEPS